jgi:hypothetical protein
LQGSFQYLRIVNSGASKLNAGGDLVRLSRGIAPKPAAFLKADCANPIKHSEHLANSGGGNAKPRGQVFLRGARRTPHDEGQQVRSPASFLHVANRQ